MNDDHDDLLTWARDWALFGAATCGVAPLTAELLLGHGFGRFVVAVVLLGAASGAGVGAVLRLLLSRLPRRSWAGVLGVFAPVPLGAWGAAVSTFGAWLTVPEFTELAFPCGSVAAVVQMLWLAPVYGALAGRGLPRWFLVVPAALLAPVGGAVAVLSTVLAMDLL